MSHVYEGEKFERATSSDSLAKRLQINKAYASADFDGWLMERLNVAPGEDVLDVGCGTGAQTLMFASQVKPGGTVSSIDISTESIASLNSHLAAEDDHVQAIAGDMADLEQVIANTFRTKTYDLAQSTYALYYANERNEVLGWIKNALKPAGRIAVFTPQEPHGLVDLAAKFGAVPQPVYDSLRFGGDVLAPWFKSNLANVEEHHFHNLLSIPTAEEVLTFYRATTYYDKSAEPEMKAYVEDIISQKGSFQYEKNGYLIIGYNQD